MLVSLFFSIFALSVAFFATFIAVQSSVDFTMW